MVASLAMATSVLAVPSPSPMMHTPNSAALGHQEPLLKGKQKVEAHRDVSSHQDVVMEAADVPSDASGHTLMATHPALEPHKEGQPAKLKESHRGKGEHSSRQAKVKHAANQLGVSKLSRKSAAREKREKREKIENLREYYSTGSSESLAKVMAGEEIEALAVKYGEKRVLARLEKRRRQRQSAQRYGPRYGLPEYIPKHRSTQMPVQHNVEKEVPMALDAHPKAPLPAQSLLEGAEERLSRLHLG